MGLSGAEFGCGDVSVPEHSLLVGETAHLCTPPTIALSSGKYA